MNYPLISEYIEAIRFAEDNFATLTNLRPVLEENGNPVMSSGNFAVVFKMEDIETGEFKAVKCFTRDQEGRKDAYKAISQSIASLKSKYFTYIKYLEFELYVESKSTDETEFPVLLMDWVEGLTLDKYIDEYKENSFVLHDLCVAFSEMSKWLVDQNIAHGDLKPDNIIIRPTGEIVLIDYDGMYTHSMAGKDARELGSVNYRLPSRSIHDFNRHIDDLPLAAICLSLKVISVIFDILNKNNYSENFLFTETDYYSPKDSSILQQIIEYSYSDASLFPYISTFLLAVNKVTLTRNNFEYGDISVSKMLRTNDREIENDSIKENSIIYSLDGRRLLKFDYEHNDEEDIYINDGVVCICEGAFSSYKANRKLNLHLPKSLRFFTQESFAYKYRTLSWDSPWFTYSEGCIYSHDYTSLVLQHLTNVILNDNLKIIEQNCFHGLDATDIVLPDSVRVIKKNAYDSAIVSPSFVMPFNLQVVEDEAFRYCKGMQSITFNSELKYLGIWSFHLCRDLEYVKFNKECRLSRIESKAFCNCEKLSTVTFSPYLNEIGESAFQWCKHLEGITLPEKLKIIEDSAFEIEGKYGDVDNEDVEVNTSCLVIPSTVESIGKSAFSGLLFINKLVVEGKPTIGEYAFAKCPNLNEFEALKLTKLVDSMFKGCCELKNVAIEELTTIGDNVFSGCSNLTFSFPPSLKNIGHGALCGVQSFNVNENFKYEEGILYDNDMTAILYFDSEDSRVKIKEGIKHINSSSFIKTPSIIELPNSVSDESIMEVLSLDTKYVKLPTGRTIDRKLKKIVYDEDRKVHTKGWDIRAESYGNSSIYIDGYGVIYSENRKTLKKYSDKLLMEVYHVLPECEMIEDNAFEGWEDCDPEFGMSYGGNNLKTLVLPKGLKKIGKNALEGCRNISRITLPNSLEIIDEGALNGCHAILSLCLPSSLITLGKNALPARLGMLESDSRKYRVYNGCLLSDEDVLWIKPGISSLSLPHSIKFRGKDCITFPNCIISNDGVLLWTVPNIPTFKFPQGIKVIGRGAFVNNKRIQSITIPEGVTSIEYSAFSCNQSLNSIYLPSSIEKIADLKTYQGWGRKYIEFFYPEEIHIPKGMKGHFLNLLPGVPERCLIDDYE